VQNDKKSWTFAGKLGICPDHPRHFIEMRFCVVGGLWVIVLISNLIKIGSVVTKILGSKSGLLYYFGQCLIQPCTTVQAWYRAVQPLWKCGRKFSEIHASRWLLWHSGFAVVSLERSTAQTWQVRSTDYWNNYPAVYDDIVHVVHVCGWGLICQSLSRWKF